MNLLYLTHENIDKSSVAHAMMYDVAKSLSEYHDVTVISATDDLEKKEYIDSEIKNIKFYRKTYGAVSYTDIIRLFMFFFIIISRIMKSDVVYVRSYAMMVFGVFSKIFGKKLVFDPRGLGFLEMIDSGKVKSIIPQGLLEKIELFFIKCSNIVICVSEAHADYYSKKYGMNKKYRVIYNGAEHVFSNPVVDLSKDEIFKIVYLGSLVKWHCPERVNSILNCLSKKGLDFEFHCITRDADKAEEVFIGNYKKKIYTHNFREKPIKFNLGICFIEDTLSKSVCFPVKFSEYVSSGTPVLFSNNIDVCNKVSNIAHVGLGVGFGDDDDFVSDSIIRYLNEGEKNIIMPDVLTKKSMINEINSIIDGFK